MIACDYCSEWYHGECVNITPEEAEKIDKYECIQCRLKKKKGIFNLNEVIIFYLASKNKNSSKKKIKEISSLNKCLWKECNNLAKSNSKYCCKECGIKTVKYNMNPLVKEDISIVNDISQEYIKIKTKNIYQYIEELKKLKFSKNEKNFSVADNEDLKLLEENLKKQELTQQEMYDLVKKENELEKSIEFASNLFSKNPIEKEVK